MKIRVDIETTEPLCFDVVYSLLRDVIDADELCRKRFATPEQVTLARGY